MTGHPAYFFGYGSLVNATTHHFVDPHPAQLSGWRRVWRHTTLRQVAYLTVVPDPASTIDGVIAAVPAGDWAGLDHRERAYARVPVSERVTHTLPHTPDIAVYSVPAEAHSAPGQRGQVFLSYLDVVVQGYLAAFGEAGAHRFFATTDGWDAEVVDDRSAPRYPRHCRLTQAESALVDALLQDVGVQVSV